MEVKRKSLFTRGNLENALEVVVMKKIILTLLFAASIQICWAAELVYDRETSDRIDSGSIEYFIQGKVGATEKGNATCEDGLFYNDHFLAVFDGATDKSGKTYEGGRKGGRVARDIILGVFETLPPDAQKEDVLKVINEKYQAFYQAHPDMDFEKNPLFRPTATLIWYSFHNKEMVAIGDSKARIDGKIYNDGSKMVDILNSDLRVKVIQELGLTEKEVAENDLGRFYILPLLEKQSEFQNNPKAPKAFQYWAIDGFEVPVSELRVWKFEKQPKVIELSSDGYETIPVKASIPDYEAGLAKLLKEDPMRIKNPSTKGLQKGNASFDDRAVLIYRLDN